MARSLHSRHGWFHPGHPRLACWFATIKTWMPGMSSAKAHFAPMPGHDKTKRPRQNRGLRSRDIPIESARIEFDDQMRLHLHRERHVGQMRDAGVFRRHLGVIDLEEVGHVALAELDRFQNDGELL